MIEDFYADAIDTVCTWDIDPGDFSDTVNAFVRLCAGDHLKTYLLIRDPAEVGARRR